MPRRLSRSTIEVLAELLAHRETGCYGYQLSEATGLASGTLYPLLARLAHDGLTTSVVQGEDETESRGPRRRYHKLTGRGVEVALEALSDTRRVAQRGLRLGGAR